VKRPPALLCTKLESQIDIGSYEIKNVINKILKELPKAAKNKELKEKLTNFVSDVEGK